MHCKLIGAPLRIGARHLGCAIGPTALRTAGLRSALEGLGHHLTDLGDVASTAFPELSHPNPAVHHLSDMAAWTALLAEVAYRESDGAIPIFLGGDHAISAGTVAGIARRAAAIGRPLFVLWLDAHSDFHTLETTRSGNLHGVPVAYFTGRHGFDGYLPPLPAPVDPARVCMIGIRSVDPAERRALAQTSITVHDMRMVREHGVGALLRPFLEKVAAENGLLHVSLDVDFLDPEVAPAVGTAVPGGATFREAHLVMEMLRDSGLVTSLDLVELNPLLDEHGRTAELLVALTASLMGRRTTTARTRRFG